MSYILEALNRSQKERELGEVPTIASPAAVSAETEKKGVSGLALAAVLLALCAVLIALYAAFGMRAVQTLPAESAPTPDAAATNTPAARPNNPVHTDEPVVTASQPKPSQPAAVAKPAADPAPAKPAAMTPPAPKPPVATKPEVKTTKPPHRNKAVETPEPTEADLRSDLEKLRDKVLRENRATATSKPKPRPPVTAHQPPARQAAPSTAKEAIPYNRLPSSVQQEIPRHRISVHVYSETASSRFVILNSKKLGEGGQTKDGLKVDEIRPDGAILNYQGRRFFQSR